jgi:hypothetical protein
MLFTWALLVGLSCAIACAAVAPDWSAITGAPFCLSPHPSVVQPVLSASDVTDMQAGYVADPFLFFSGGQWYLFMEVLDAAWTRGQIGLATSPDGLRWTYRRIVLQESFHLSFPQVFSNNGTYYMLPETNETNSVRLYRATSFPYTWRLANTLVSGRAFVDPQIVRYNNTWWLFVSDTSNAVCYLYYSDNLTSGWVEHPKSPIVGNDSGRARAGGRMLLYNGNTLIRTAQKCDSSYGEAVRAFQVDALTKTDYGEHEIPESPILRAGSESWNERGMHQFDPWWTGSRWLVAVDGVDASGVWAIGLYSPAADTPSAIPKSAWRLKSADSQELQGENGAAVNAFDNDPSTFWHTQWSAANPPCPHEIQIDLGASYSIGGFRYLPRQDGSSNGMVKQYEFYVSVDGQSWGSAKATGAFAAGTSEKEVLFTSATGRFVRFRALSEVNSNPWTSMGELSVLGQQASIDFPSATIDTPPGNVTIDAGEQVAFSGTGTSPGGNLPLAFRWTFGTDSGIPDSTVEDPGSVRFDRSGAHAVKLTVTDSKGNVDPSPPTRTISLRPSTIPKSAWRLKSADSQELQGENGAAVNAFDNDPSTFWHTQWSAANPPCPHEIQIDLGASYSIGGFRYLPRQDGSSNGMVKQYEFYVSVDGQSWGSAKATGAFAAGTSEKEVLFTSATGRFVRFRALSEVNSNPWTSMGELSVLGNAP